MYTVETPRRLSHSQVTASLNTPQETPIEIPEVRQFSIGETEDRQPCIWALGRRQAWFEIKPSAGYKATYDAMAEAVFLYYRIVDFYGCPDERTPMPGKRDEITRLFHQVSSCENSDHNGFGLTAYRQVCFCGWGRFYI